MFKEIVICVIIVVSIFSVDMYTQNYTTDTTNQITKIFSKLKEEIINEDKVKIKNIIKELDEIWNEKHHKLAYYIEHDELEKVDVSIINMKSFVETEDFASAIAEVDEGKFILEHIKDKYEFTLENVF